MNRKCWKSFWLEIEGWSCWKLCSFSSVYECLPNGSSDEKKAQCGQSHSGRISDFRTVQNTARTTWPAVALLSHNIDDCLDGYNVILSVLHGTDVVFPGNPIFFSPVFPLKFFRS